MSDNPVSLTHAVYRPKSTSPGKPPLLVLLHGVGSNEQDLIGLAPFLDDRFLIVSLRAPLTIGPQAFGWYEIEWTQTGVKHDAEGALRGQAAAEQAIAELVTRYDVDPQRVYVMGFSQGAIMSLGIALSHPETVAGAVIMSGRLLPEFATRVAEPGRLSGFPIIVVHGTQDGVLPLENGRQIKEFLDQLPVELTYREYAMAHTVSQESLSDISTWLKARL